MRVFAVLFAGILVSFGCSKREGLILGQAPKGDPCTITTVKTVGAGSSVVLNGTMIEKCPVAGCWFRLRDDTGTIKVDTRSAGFVVANIPVNSKLVVSGKLVTDGDDVTIEAMGIRY